MTPSRNVFFALQIFLFQCYAYPRFAVRDAHPQITAAPVLGAVPENELLRRQDSCTWACAVCALYAPCENCVSLSTPAGMECCTSKLADQSACPTANVPADSTIYIYTLGTLTVFGNPTSLVIDSQTLTPGGAPIIASGHTLSVPATATGGGLVEDGTAITLGTPISTVVGTGSGPASTLCLVQELSDGQANVPCSATSTGIQATSTNTNTNPGVSTGTATAGTNTGTNTNTNTNTGTTASTVTAGTNTDTNTGTNTGANSGTSQSGTGAGSGTTTDSNAQATTAAATGTNTNTDSGTNTGTGTGTGVDTNTATGTGTVSGTNTATGTGTATGVSINTDTATKTNADTGLNTNTNTGTNTQTGPGTGAGSNTATDTGTSASTITGASTANTNAAAPSTYTIDGITFTGNPTSLVAGTVTLTPGGPGLTTSGHTIAILTSATGGQIQVDGTATPLPGPNAATGTGTGTTGTNVGTNTGTITGTGELSKSVSIYKR